MVALSLFLPSLCNSCLFLWSQICIRKAVLHWQLEIKHWFVAVRIFELGLVLGDFGTTLQFCQFCHFVLVCVIVVYGNETLLTEKRWFYFSFFAWVCLNISRLNHWFPVFILFHFFLKLIPSTTWSYELSPIASGGGCEKSPNRFL